MARIVERPGGRMLLTATLLLCLAAVEPLHGDTIPDQFRVWGKRAAPNVYLKDIEDAASTAQPSPTAAESARGFIVFSKPVDQVIAPDYGPASADRCSALKASDCPGQYGPLSFCIYALRPGDYSVNLTDLAGPSAHAIARENLDIRAVRYVSVMRDGKPTPSPLLLESVRAKPVPAQRVQQFWITYYVPETAAPGAYMGKARILVGGVEKLAIPIRLTVYPFKLAEPDASLYIYYNNSTRPKDLQCVRNELIDQRCHGMNMAPLDMPMTSDGTLTRETVAPFLDAYKSAGFLGREIEIGLWNRITAEWLNTPDKTIGMWGPWFRYYPFSERLDARYVATVKMLRDEARKRGLSLELEVSDEPGSHAWTTEATQHYFDLVKSQAPDVKRELSVGGGWAMGRPEDDLWRGRAQIWTTNRWLPDKLARVRSNDPAAKIRLYNMAGGGSTAGGIGSARALYGFFCWKAHAAGAAQWVYYHPETLAENYTWPAVDSGEAGVPTLRWEMVREGAKDLRYLTTLEKRLSGKKGATADSARAFLAEIGSQIPLRTEDYDPVGGGRIPAQPPGVYDGWRAAIAAFIRKL